MFPISRAKLILSIVFLISGPILSLIICLILPLFGLFMGAILVLFVMGGIVLLIIGHILLILERNSKYLLSFGAVFLALGFSMLGFGWLISPGMAQVAISLAAVSFPMMITGLIMLSFGMLRKSKKS